MGISQLLPFIDSVAVDRHLRDFYGTTCAIDGYYWLHKAARTCAMEMVRGTYTTKFVEYCLGQVHLLRTHGVEPLVVLDGAALPAKAGEEQHRRRKREIARAEANEMLRSGPYDKAQASYLKAVNVTPEHAYQLMCALRKHNVQYIVAPYEADAQIARLARTGVVSLVLAEDSDMLAFGCPRVFTKMDHSGHGKLLERSALAHAREPAGGSVGANGQPALLFSPWEEWNGDGEDGGRFLELCILAGCDYLEHLPGMAMKTAHKQLRKYKTAERVVRQWQMEGKAAPPPGGYDQYLKVLRQAKQTFRHQRVYDMEQRKVVPLNPELPGAVRMPHCGADIDDAVAFRLCAVGDLHPDTRQPMTVLGMPPPPPLPHNHGVPKPQGWRQAAAHAQQSFQQPLLQPLLQPPPHQPPPHQPPPHQPPPHQPPPQYQHVQPPPFQQQLQPPLPQPRAMANGPPVDAPVDAPAAWAARLPPSAGSSAVAASLGFTAAANWPVAAPARQSEPTASSSGASKRPAVLVQSNLPGSFRPEPPPASGLPRPSSMPELQSKAESKRPFKKPRSSLPPPSHAGGAPPPSLTGAAVRSGAPRGGVSGLQRSRFFGQAATTGTAAGTAAGREVAAGDGAAHRQHPLESAQPSAQPGDAGAEGVTAGDEDVTARSQAAVADMANPESVPQPAEHSAVAQFAFTPSAAAASRPRRSPRMHAVSGGGSGKARDASAAAWDFGFGEGRAGGGGGGRE